MSDRLLDGFDSKGKGKGGDNRKGGDERRGGDDRRDGHGGGHGDFGFGGGHGHADDRRDGHGGGHGDFGFGGGDHKGDKRDDKGHGGHGDREQVMYVPQGGGHHDGHHDQAMYPQYQQQGFQQQGYPQQGYPQQQYQQGYPQQQYNNQYNMQDHHHQQQGGYVPLQNERGRDHRGNNNNDDKFKKYAMPDDKKGKKGKNDNDDKKKKKKDKGSCCQSCEEGCLGVMCFPCIACIVCCLICLIMVMVCCGSKFRDHCHHHHHDDDDGNTTTTIEKMNKKYKMRMRARKNRYIQEMDDCHSSSSSSSSSGSSSYDAEDHAESRRLLELDTTQSEQSNKISGKTRRSTRKQIVKEVFDEIQQDKGVVAEGPLKYTDTNLDKNDVRENFLQFERLDQKKVSICDKENNCKDKWHTISSELFNNADEVTIGRTTIPLNRFIIYDTHYNCTDDSAEESSNRRVQYLCYGPKESSAEYRLVQTPSGYGIIQGTYFEKMIDFQSSTSDYSKDIVYGEYALAGVALLIMGIVAIKACCCTKRN